jgi:hypothetical protein
MSEGIKQALLDLARTAVSTSIAVWLGLGISIFDADADALKAVIAAGIAAALQVAMKYLDPSNVAYGIVSEAEVDVAAEKSAKRKAGK